MANPPNDPMDEVLRRSLESSSDRKLQRFIEGANAITQLREQFATSVQREAESNDWLKEHLASAREAATRWGTGLQEQADGLRSGEQVWKELTPLWSKAFSREAESRLADAFSKLGVSSSGVDELLLGAALGVDSRSIPTWTARRTMLGTTFVALPEESTPSTSPSDEVGTNRQALDDKPLPQRICLSAPYASSSAGQSRDGVAVITNRAGISLRTGTGFIDSTTFAPVLAGGGGSVSMPMGGDVNWRKGHTVLSISAAVSLSASMRAITILGGATTSLEVILFAGLSDGRSFMSTSFVGAATAPLLFLADVIVQPGTVSISLPDITLDGDEGSAIVLAGVRGFTAAVGIGGSAAARVQSNFSVDEICANVS